ncbi:hypothetical protein ACRJ4W_39705 [Streptomyces sp. GLT-R25]
MDAVDLVGDGVTLALLDSVGEADGDWLGDSEADGDGSSRVVSGTLARMSSGAALSRDGVSYENSPLANPAAATTAAVAPAPTSAKRRRRPVFSDVGSTAGSSWWASSKRLVSGAEGPGSAVARGSWAVAPVSAGSGSYDPCVALVGGGSGGAPCAYPYSCSYPRACPSSVPSVAGTASVGVASGVAGSRSTYGRMRSGSKASAAAVSAERVSRRASAARRAQSHVGEPSDPQGTPHSGHM